MTEVVQGSERYRVFVDLGTSACASGCTYCYVLPGRSIPYGWREIESALDGLLESRRFVPGKSGTIITFGGHTEIFRSRALIELLIRALPRVCQFGNPVQVSTKQFVNEETVRAIQNCGRYVGQISLFVSCASISTAILFERAADPPRKRWATFSNLRIAGLPCSLLIKPWLGGTTRRDLMGLARIAADFSLDAVCLGALYVTRRISESVSSLDLQNEGSRGTATHPLIVEPHFSISPPACVMSEFQARLYPIPLFSSTICVSATFARVRCPLHSARPCLDTI